MENPSDVTQLLERWASGDQDAFAGLAASVYSELHRLAHIYMAGERPGHTLQTTALVNEVYLKLVDTSRVRWQDRAHFFAVAARLMRQILIDYARARKNQKRGGGWRQVTFDDALGGAASFDTDLLELDQALDRLSKLDPRKAQVVEMRFFGGMSLAETAEALHISEDTVGRDWDAAKAWLMRELRRRDRTR